MGAGPMRVVVDDNVLIDYLIDREPFSEAAMLLMELGYLGEVELWMGTSQITDMLYVITDGGKASRAEEAKRTMRALRRMVHIYATDEEDYDAVASGAFDDLEDAFVYQTALKVKADAIITRDQQGFRRSSIKIFDCAGFFEHLEEEKGMAYADIA